MTLRHPSGRTSGKAPLPRLWLITDERFGDGLLAAARKLPHGAGIVFRHYHLAPAGRYRLFRQLRRIAAAKGLVLLLARPKHGQIARWAADGSYGSPAYAFPPGKAELYAAPVHDLREIRMAERGGADLLMLSPIFPTRSHPDRKTLGPACFSRLAQKTSLPVIALGGVHRETVSKIRYWKGYGVAGIGLFLETSAQEIRI